MRLVVATGNQGKLKEIRRLLEGTGLEVAGLAEFEDLPEIVEDGDSFADNACKKARIIAETTGCLTLADDSGLVVEALDGAPGVYSARYAGDSATDQDNNLKLLNALADVDADNRRAAFHCVMALVDVDGTCRTFDGQVQGLILSEGRGEGGFGYDPLFLVPEYGKTMAELPLEIKNRISHRGTALRKLLVELGALS